MRVLHVFRSPVGGLFRHVRDLVRGQHMLGHEVGIICDSSTGGDAAKAALAALAPHCSLGISRRHISTLPGLGDVAGRRAVMEQAQAIGVDVIHGHGAKGGVYARLAAKALGLRSVYTPHGGSLHYDWLRPPGSLFLAAERALRFKNSGLVFVCAFERALFDRKIGLGPCPNIIVYNGLWPEDFAPRKMAADAADFFYIGEMRKLKGVGVLLQALAQLPSATRPTLSLIGEGRDKAAFEALAQQLGLDGHVRFLGRKSFHEAAAAGHVMVMPSRHESFPYVVLEALAAGVPLIASDVGGIPEAVEKIALVPIGDSAALASAMAQAKANFPELAQRAAVRRKEAMTKFDAKDMAKAICDFYQRLN
jgi:glycosyltransferase involved in cell wall biosynthesis